MASNNPAAAQAVKLGELKMAEGVIGRRIESTLKTLGEHEKLKLEEVKRKVERDMGLDKETDRVAKLEKKVTEKIAGFVADYEAEKNAINVKYGADLKALSEKTTKKKADVQVELDAEKTKLAELNLKVANKVADDSAEIKRKAADIRAHLTQERARLDDLIYATVLPENLKAVVDQAPKIGEEGKLVKLEHSTK